MKTVEIMDPTDLLLWRKRNKLDQKQLAALLGVHVNTVSYWETGRQKLPIDLWPRLQNIERIPALERLANKKKAPEAVIPKHAHLRPDLRLFGAADGYGGHLRGDEHPRRLLAPRLDDVQLIPWSILESPEYLAALAAHRSKSTPVAQAPAELEALHRRFMEENE